MFISHDPNQASVFKLNDSTSLGRNWQLRIILQLRERLSWIWEYPDSSGPRKSRTQSPRAFWSAGERSTANQKPRGIWVRDLPLPRFQILCGFKTFHSGVLDLHAGFAGYVWNEGESVKKKLRFKKISGYVWTGTKLLSLEATEERKRNSALSSFAQWSCKWL